METSPYATNRRNFLASTSALGAATFLGLPRTVGAEPPPETTALRIFEGPVTCLAPQVIAHDLLLSEGFTDIRYIRYPNQTDNWPPQGLASREFDIGLSFVPTDLVHIDEGDPIVILAGSHIGCTEVFGSDRVRSTPDLKGKTVAISKLRSDEHLFISMVAAYVGLHPEKDINWVVRPHVDDVRLLTGGKIDAFMAGPPASIELRAKKIGHVLINMTTDKPWSQYFCCVLISSKEFVRQYPMATKRALRAIIKGADVCAAEPKRVARLLADKGLARYEYTLQTLEEIPYGRWRDYDVEDTVRFYALRMGELGLIKSTPQKIITEGTDWRFLKELKKELKA